MHICIALSDVAEKHVFVELKSCVRQFCLLYVANELCDV